MKQMLAEQAARGAPVPQPAAQPQPVPVGAGAEAEGAQLAAAEGFDETDPSTWGNPGRNEQCPCGSGKKFKHCHGRLV